MATDIAARGIDVPGVEAVINYDLPEVPESYVHRIGRTARAGTIGDAISFCSELEIKKLRAIERLIKNKIKTENYQGSVDTTIKEAGNNVQQYLELLKNKPEDFLIISGDDDLALSVVLAGAAGVISVIGQGFPKEFSSLIKLGLEGKNKEAYELHYRLMDAISLIFSENNPAGIKCVLNTRGIIKNELRLPIVPASESLQQKIVDFMDNF